MEQLIKHWNQYKDINQQCKDIGLWASENSINIICGRIENGNIKILESKKTIKELLDEQNATKFEKIEKIIKQQQLKDVQRQKELLQNKIRGLEDNIQQLQINQEFFKNSNPKQNLDIDDPEERERKKKEQELLLKKLRQERKQLEQKRLERLQENDQKIKDLEKIKEEEEKKKKDDDKQKKKALALEKLDELKKRSQQRQEIISKQNEYMKEIMKSKPLYLEYEDRYKNETVKTLLDERKKKLAEIRDLRKPVSIDEIIQHQRKIDILLSEKKLINNNSGDKFVYKPPYQSYFYKKVAEEQSAREVTRQTTPTKVHLKSQQDVTLLKKPQVSEYKKKEREENIGKLKHRPNFHWYIKDKEKLEELNKSKDKEQTPSPRQLGNDYLKQCHDQVKLIKAKNKQRNLNDSCSAPSPEKNNEKNSLSSVINNFDSNNNDAMNTENMPLDERRFSHQSKTISINKLTRNTLRSDAAPKRKNYLQELREKHNVKFENNGVNLQEWQKIVTKKDQQPLTSEQTEQLLIQAEKMEEIARRKEQLQKVKGFEGAGTQDDQQIDDYYINAIKAKLAVLE